MRSRTELARELWEQGLGVVEIARRLEVHHSSVVRMLSKHRGVEPGIRTRRKEENIARTAALMGQGMPVKQIAEELGVSKEQALRYTKAARERGMAQRNSPNPGRPFVNVDDLKWQVKGTCAELLNQGGPDVDRYWFAQKTGRPSREDLERYEHAKEICRACPVLDQCREYGLRIEQGMSRSARWGVYGGLDPDERMAEEKRRKEGRVA